MSLGEKAQRSRLTAPRATARRDRVRGLPADERAGFELSSPRALASPDKRDGPKSRPAITRISGR